jgi:3-hydroxymyristoyl/3-hydroxydecanoyl-(acyl carrier protein) dehydratase
MKLIDRILAFEPQGGRFGLGMIRAEADIHPDDWFLTCHFVDDMTMPGTLMYECCAHALRVFLQRIGWLTTREDVCYQPVVGVKSVLKCRGPVTPQTRQVVYEVEIKEIGYGPDPYVIADANMYADGHYIVRFTDMSLKMTGLTRRELEDFWQRRVPASTDFKDQRRSKVLFDRDKILAFAVGRPSEAFGERFKIFDENRFIARLPGPPYSFIDRVVTVAPPAGVLNPGGWIEAEYDVQPDDWYFRANRSPVMPFCVLLEIALQPCGWLAAYAGSALTSDKDLKFRNLDGRCIQYIDVLPDAGTLTMRSRLRKVARAGDIIIEEFDLEVLQDKKRVYAGVTSFGFFTSEALTDQKGIQEEAASVYRPQPAEIETARSTVFQDQAPLTPDDPNTEPLRSLAMPARAIRMIDRIDIYLPQGGPAGLGYVRGNKRVDPKEWFFKAHFYRDPVCPGSLGIESFLQLLKYAALQRWPHLSDSHYFMHSTELPHVWKYRGQILSENQQIEVEACVTAIGEDPPEIRADGYLYVDGLCIYKMENFGIRLLPK